jgi:hypothetical protein
MSGGKLTNTSASGGGCGCGVRGTASTIVQNSNRRFCFSNGIGAARPVDSRKLQFGFDSRAMNFALNPNQGWDLRAMQFAQQQQPMMMMPVQQQQQGMGLLGTLALVNAGIGVLGQVVNMTKTSEGSHEPRVREQAPPNVGQTANTLSGKMEGAKDSIALRNAIGEAETSVIGLDTEIADLTKIVNDETKKTAAETAKAEVKETQKEIKEKADEVKKAQGTVSEKKQTVESYEKSLQYAERDLGEKQEAYHSAVTALGTAKQNLSRAEAMPDTVPGTDGKPVPNTKKQEAVSAAEKEVERTQKDLDTRDQEVKAATNLTKEQKDKLEKAKNNFLEAKENLGNAEAQRDQLTAELTKLQEKEKAAQEIADAYDKAQTDLKAKTGEKSKLEASVNEQKKRLETMQEKEAKELKGLESSIEKRDGELEKLRGIDNYDGNTDKTEKKANKKEAELAQKQAEEQKRANVLRQRVAAMPAAYTAIDGTQFKKMGDVYMIGDKFVDKKEYDEKYNAAYNRQPLINLNGTGISDDPTAYPMA